MNIRPLTEQEKEWCRTEGVNPDPMGVVYSNEHDLHLRNHITGSEVILYWGLKHLRETGNLQ